MLMSPTSKEFQSYYADLSAITAQGAVHEQATRFAFSKLLDSVAKPRGWTVLLEQKLGGSLSRPDATLQDEFKIPRGYWEAKDTGDDLDLEIQKKIKRKYPLTNTIFEDTRRAVLYQNGRVVLDSDIRDPKLLADLLARFFGHTDEQIEEFHRAVAQFKDDIPKLADGLKTIIDDARQSDPKFAGAFDDFHALCKGALNPAIHADAIEEMLVQHLLTERLFRTVLDNAEFTQRNVIAHEIEKVIGALTERAFSRQDFLKRLDYFYVAIEAEARTITTYAEKQGFLNTVYERFFQGFSKGQADTHGIVYTPQPIVDFMCESVEHVLKTEFGQSLSDKGVVILDPCTGTGNFLVNILRRLSHQNLKHKYEHELFANEVMLLPYYIASLNVEHAYFEKMGHYKAFEGLCFTDTLDLADAAQPAFSIFNPENTQRVKAEKAANITVIIGNPPYNVGQQNENDNNKNRRYGVVDGSIRATYAKDSKATLKTKLYDAYVRFFRWATDRLGDRDGIVCFVTNNSLVHKDVFDGLRKHLAQDFTDVYHLDMGGDARTDGGGSVFGIRVGAGITLLVRRRAGRPQTSLPGSVHYHALENQQSGLAKLAALKALGDLSKVGWQTLETNARHSWMTEGLQADFSHFLPIGSKETKNTKNLDVQAIFKTYSLGVSTNRDSIVYDFDQYKLAARVSQFIADYNNEVSRWKNAGRPKDVDAFVQYDRIKWSRNLKNELRRGHNADFVESAIVRSSYRPFTNLWLYSGKAVIDEHGTSGTYFPGQATQDENRAIAISDHGHRAPFSALAVNGIPDLHLLASTDGFQCFPLYTYALDGKLRRDNVTDWALGQFRERYGPDVTKRDIFHYVYALLHHPEYRERYKENLKRELPRIPLVGPTEPLPPVPSPVREGGGGAEVSPLLNREGYAQEGITSYLPPSAGVGSAPFSPFRLFAEAGARLAALHVGYEQAEEYPLKWDETEGVPFSWRVTKMRLAPDKMALKVNTGLTLTGIPPEAFAYRLGNRSALEWVIDQYQVSTDKRSGIVSDPNREDDPEYIIRLVGRVVTVSVETARIVAALPPLGLAREEAP